MKQFTTIFSTAWGSRMNDTAWRRPWVGTLSRCGICWETGVPTKPSSNMSERQADLRIHMVTCPCVRLRLTPPPPFHSSATADRGMTAPSNHRRHRHRHQPSTPLPSFLPSFPPSAPTPERCTRVQPLPASLTKPSGPAAGRAISRIVRAAPAAGTYTDRPHKKFTS